jgi:gas vesicle structural protein
MAIKRHAASDSVVDVLDRVLDKGIVIDAKVDIAVVGLELVTLNIFVTVASFQTWDRHVAVRRRAEDHRRTQVERDARPAAAPAGAPVPHRARLRCESGCTFERRSTALLIGDGRLEPQRCAMDARRRCEVTVI